jgi:hypothetical protein
VTEAEERAAHPVVDEATLTASLGSTARRSCATPTRRRPGSSSRPRRGRPRCCARRRARSTSCRRAPRPRRPSGSSRSSCWWRTPSRRPGVESERIFAEAMADGEAVIARAKDEGRALLEQVQEARRRVLADLASRRRALGIQIEQLRAARDEMAASVHGVRDRVDGILASWTGPTRRRAPPHKVVADQFRLGTAPSWPPRPGRDRTRRGGGAAEQDRLGERGRCPGADARGGRRRTGCRPRSTSSSPASAPARGDSRRPAASGRRLRRPRLRPPEGRDGGRGRVRSGAEPRLTAVDATASGSPSSPEDAVDGCRRVRTPVRRKRVSESPEDEAEVATRSRRLDHRPTRRVAGRRSRRG